MKVTRWTDLAIWDAIDEHAMFAAEGLASAATCTPSIRERLVRMATRHALAFVRLRDAALAAGASR